MDRNKYDFLNTLLDKEIEIAKNRSLSFTDSRNSFLTNVQKSHLNTSQQNQNQDSSFMKERNQQQNNTYDNSTTNNSYMYNLNASNNKSYNDISYEDSRNYYDKKVVANEFTGQFPQMQHDIPQRGRDQSSNYQNNLFDRINNSEVQKQNSNHQELASSNNKNNISLSGYDSSLKINSNGFHLKGTPDHSNKQQFQGVDSSIKNNFENSLTNYQQNSRSALQVSQNQSSGFSPLDHNKASKEAIRKSPESGGNKYIPNSGDNVKTYSPIAQQAQNQIEYMRKQISQNTFQSFQLNTEENKDNVSAPFQPQNNHQYQQQQRLQQLFQNYGKQSKQQSTDTYNGKSQNESYSMNHQYESNLSNSEEKKNQFQREFESIQMKIQALEDKLKITEEKNSQLAGISQENEQFSIVSQQNYLMNSKDGNTSLQMPGTFQYVNDQNPPNSSIFTNQAIKQKQKIEINNDLHHHNVMQANEISPRFNIQDSIFFQQQQESHSKNNPSVQEEESKIYNKQSYSSSGKKRKIKSSSRKSEAPNSDTDSGMKPKNIDTTESIESNRKYLKKLEVQILNDSRDIKDDSQQKSKQIRFKTPNYKKNSSLPPTASHSNNALQPSSTSNILKQVNTQSPITNKEEKNMYSDELKALQKELQMWEYRKEKQHLQLQHMQDNNKRNSSKLTKLKKQANKLVKIKKEQELHLTEYDQLYHNFEKCELIRQKQKILVSCLKDELKLLQKKGNQSKQMN